MPNFITEKVGPLPAWGWLLIGIGGYFVIRMIGGNRAQAQQQPSYVQVPTGAASTGANGGIGGSQPVDLSPIMDGFKQLSASMTSGFQSVIQGQQDAQQQFAQELAQQNASNTDENKSLLSGITDALRQIQTPAPTPAPVYSPSFTPPPAQTPLPQYYQPNPPPPSFQPDTSYGHGFFGPGAQNYNPPPPPMLPAPISSPAPVFTPQVNPMVGQGSFAGGTRIPLIGGPLNGQFFNGNTGQVSSGVVSVQPGPFPFIPAPAYSGPPLLQGPSMPSALPGVTGHYVTYPNGQQVWQNDGAPL